MALSVMQQAPSISGVYGVRDSSQQLSDATSSNAKALQNAFSFATHMYDYLNSRKQANIMEDKSKEKSDLAESLKADQAKLAELQSQLAALGG